MTGTKTVAERLRETEDTGFACEGDVLAFALGRELKCPVEEKCSSCIGRLANELADAIEAEQAELDKRIEVLESDRDDYIEHVTTFACWQMQIANMLNIPLAERNDSGEVQAKIIAALKERTKTEQNGVDVDALLKLDGTFCHWAEMAAKNNDACQKIDVGTLLNTAKRIRDAVKGANASKPQLPEGVIWPTYEDGELVKFGDEFIAPEYGENEPQKLTRLVLYAEEHFPDGTEGALWDANYLRPGGAIGKDYRLKRPEPEVLDADGVPIKVGDTVWHEADGSELTVVGFRDEKEDGEVMVDVEGKWFCVRQFSLTHRKPDTQEAINHDAALLVSESFFDQRRDEFEDRVFDLLKRQRKLMGGE